MRKINSPYVWAVLSALTLAFAFPAWDWFFLAYFSIIFQLIAIHQCSNKKQILLIGLLVPQVANYIAFEWIPYVLQEVGQMHWLAAKSLHLLFGFICLPVYTSFFLCGYALRSFSRRIPIHLQAIYWAFLWTCLEFLWRPLKIFPESLGSSQLPWLSFSQMASIGGVELLSFLIVFVAASLFFYYREKKIAYGVGITLVLLVTIHFWGEKRIEHIRTLPKDSIPVAVVQTNIGNTDKMLARQGIREGLRSIVNAYLELTTKATKTKPSLILWAETAYPMTFPASPQHQSTRFSQGEAWKIFRHVEEHGYSLLFGTYEHMDGHHYNSVALLDEKASIRAIYRKYHLLLFGEYMPFSDIWPSLKKLNPILGDFSSGPGPQPIPWQHEGRSLLLGINICYEALVSPYMHALAKAGTQSFINFTNDSWFGPTNEPYQHLALSAFRSIENGLPLLRVTNTGLSAFVDANGKILQRGPLFQKTVLTGNLFIYKEKIQTLYQAYASFFPSLTICIFLLFNGAIYFSHFPMNAALWRTKQKK